jgi:hypothetical protein
MSAIKSKLQKPANSEDAKSSAKSEEFRKFITIKELKEGNSVMLESNLPSISITLVSSNPINILSKENEIQNIKLSSISEIEIFSPSKFLTEKKKNTTIKLQKPKEVVLSVPANFGLTSSIAISANNKEATYKYTFVTKSSTIKISSSGSINLKKPFPLYLIILISVVVILLFSAGGYYLYKKNKTTE